MRYYTAQLPTIPPMKAMSRMSPSQEIDPVNNNGLWWGGICDRGGTVGMMLEPECHPSVVCFIEQRDEVYRGTEAR